MFIRIIFCVIVVRFALPYSAFAQCPIETVPITETPSVNGTVLALAASDSVVYVGGDFNYIGPKSGGGVLVDKTTGERRATFPVSFTVK